MNEVNSAMLKARYLFYKKHPEIAPITANDNLIAEWASENVLSLELVNTWDIASRALEGALAKNAARVEVQPITPPEAPAESPEPTDLRKLSVPELREMVKSQRVDFTRKLPDIYTPEKIRGMSAIDLRQLQTKYGSATLNARLRGEK